MTHTITRPSSMRARKIEPTGIAGDTPTIRKRQHPITPSDDAVADLEWAVMNAGPFCYTPFLRHPLSKTFTDEQRLEMYRLRVSGLGLRKVCEITGVNERAVSFAVKWVTQNYEAMNV